MDYQAKFTQLVSIIDPKRAFPIDFDWQDEKAIARAICSELDARDRQAQARNRGRLYD